MSAQGDSLQDRLRDESYDKDACLAAMRGQAVPHALGHQLHRIAVIRGIRHHPNYGTGLRGALPDFTRALNARDIMNNVVPEIKAADEMPYCIWHPVIASETTYRQLARRYPSMIYHVGRACAVAGYTQLYLELDIMPDVHIAEEARECGNVEILDAIMSRSVRYSIMNDYKMLVNPSDRRPAYLNGDTAVRWTLDTITSLPEICLESDDDWNYFSSNDFTLSLWLGKATFNITEDMNVAPDSVDGRDSNFYRSLGTRPHLQLLSEPLPADLPFVEKDVLIVMAAYHGDIDRYVRLRRPRMVRTEVECCVRGIYHNSLFAAWWNKQPKKGVHIGRAINARFIMNDVLSGAPYEDVPYVIWWPKRARENTYRILVKIQPEMIIQIVHACIYAGYEKLFDDLLEQITPDKALLLEAEKQGNLHFRQALAARLQSLGVEAPHPYRGWQVHCIHPPRSGPGTVSKFIDNDSVHTDFFAPYNGLQCDAHEVETLACIPDDWKIAADDEGQDYDGVSPNFRDLDYETWPKGFRTVQR